MAINEQEREGRMTAAADYVATRLAWEKYFRRWFAVYYVLGVLLLLCSATAASSKQVGLPEKYASILSLLVVILTGNIGFFKPEDRGSRYRQAWSLLTIQLSRFLYDPTYTVNDVIQAYEQGEAIIHQAPAAPQLPQSSVPHHTV